MKMSRSEMKRRIREEYGMNPLELSKKSESMDMLRLVKVYHELKKEKDARMIDDITWEDIEMDEVFFRVNHTRSFAGEQILYHMLHMIKKDNKSIDAEADTFDQDEELRVDTEMKLRTLGKRYSNYYLPDTIWSLEGLNLGHTFIYPLLLLLLIASIVVGIIRPSFMGAAIVMAVINLTVYSVMKLRYENTFVSISSIRELVELGEKIKSSEKLSKMYMDKEMADSLVTLDKITRMLILMKYTKSLADNGEPYALILQYIYGITMIDPILCSIALRKVSAHENELIRLYEMIGRIDAAISVASFRRSLDSCKPEITEDGTISCEGLYHPLIDHPVKNDFVMKKNSFFTGANATGKSTFMKAIAINVILGETINTCTADSMSFPKMYVMTSMALRDDVLNGESYYVREIKYLKRMLEQVSTGEKTLLVIDEILKGTNTKERVAASRAVLEYLSDTSAVVITATHDIELVEQMEKTYDAYYFECLVNDGEVKFSYEMREGINKITNAIELMKGMKFPKEITDKAESVRDVRA